MLALADSKWSALSNALSATLKRLVANIGAALRDVEAAAEQFKDLDRCGCLLRYLSDRIAHVIGPPQPPPERAGSVCLNMP